MKNSAIFFSFAFVSFALGCGGELAPTSSEPLHSATIETSALTGSMTAQSTDGAMHVYAALFSEDRDGKKLGVVLDPGDVLTASVDGSDPVAMTIDPATTTVAAVSPDYSELFDEPATVHYVATFPPATAAENVTIAFTRANGMTSAPNTIIPVPVPFAIVSTPPASIAFPGPLPVTLNAPPALLVLQAVGACLSPDPLQHFSFGPNPIKFDKNGNGEINTGALVFASDSSGGCEVTFSLDGFSDPQPTIDPAFGNSLDVEGVQKRTFDVNITR